MLPDLFSRLTEFDLVDFWEGWCREYESQPPFCARVRISPEVFPLLAEYVGARAHPQLVRSPLPEEDGWVTLTLPFESFVEARTRLLGLGRAVEVLEPESLRKSLIDFAEQIVGFYNKVDTAV